jgi:FG-GAP repeat
LHRLTHPLLFAALVVSLAVSAAIAHADSSPFRFRFTVSPWSGVGFSLGVGDVDGDGVPDAIVPNGNQAQVFSGTTGHVLFTLTPPEFDVFDLSFSSYAVGDLEGDGHNEVVVGAPGACESGRVYVFSGSTGQLQFSLKSPSSPDACSADLGGAFGESVALVRAAQGRGSDVVVGSPAETNGGSVFIFSGSTHSLLRTLPAPRPAEEVAFGFNLRAADGAHGPVLAIASYGGAVSPQPPGRVYVFSSLTTPDFVIENPEPDHFQDFGMSGLALQIDRQGKPVVAVGEFNQAPALQGQAFVFSGATLLYKLTTPNPEPTSLFGVSLAFADLGGSSPSLLVGAPAETVNGNAFSGRVYVFNARGRLTETLMSGNPQTNDGFGLPVIFSRGACEATLVVGAPSADFSNAKAEDFDVQQHGHDDKRCGSRGP